MRQTMGDTMTMRGSVYIEQFRNGRRIDARFFDNLVVTVGVQWLAGALSGDTSSPSLMKYVGIGTSTTAAGTTQTALVTEIETRAAGTQSRVTTTLMSDSYQAVGTITLTGTHAVTECGIFSASSSGSMMARQTFAAINGVATDTIQVTWKIKFASG